MMSTPKGKQFDFSETQIFGKFDLFCRRLIKLMDMFSTMQQFKSLSEQKFEVCVCIYMHLYMYIYINKNYLYV
jgi:hypothetical protein